MRISGGWRVAVVYDLSRAALEPGPPNPYHDPPPPDVLRAFRTAVAAIPDHGDRWEPQHYLLELLTDPPRHRGPPQDYGAARPWPADLAVPPPTLQPDACDLITQGTSPDAVPCYFSIGPDQAAAARRADDARYDRSHHLRPLRWRNVDWLPVFRPRYAGQTLIRTLYHCATARPPAS